MASAGWGKAVPPGSVHAAGQEAGQEASQKENRQTPMAEVDQWQDEACLAPALWFPALWHLVVSGAGEETAVEYGVAALEWWAGGLE